MTSVLFQTQLSNALTGSTITFSCILFGADVLSLKEQRFRLMCQSKYPYYHIIEPVVIRPMKLLSPVVLPDAKVS